MKLFERLGPPVSPVSWDRESEPVGHLDNAGLSPLTWWVIYAHMIFAFSAFAALMVLGA